jgi:hypothetical protein
MQGELSGDEAALTSPLVTEKGVAAKKPPHDLSKAFHSFMDSVKFAGVLQTQTISWGISAAISSW